MNYEYPIIKRQNVKVDLWLKNYFNYFKGQQKNNTKTNNMGTHTKVSTKSIS